MRRHLAAELRDAGFACAALVVDYAGRIGTGRAHLGAAILADLRTRPSPARGPAWHAAMVRVAEAWATPDDIAEAARLASIDAALASDEVMP